MPRVRTRRPVRRVTEKALMAKRLCLSLMQQHQLDMQLWSFRFIRSKRNAGCCVYLPENKGIIELSTDIIEVNPWDEIKDTILHEIAHARVGQGNGHNIVWKREAVRLGAKPRACNTQAQTPPARWQAICGGCSYIYKKYRRPSSLTGWHCRRCGKGRGNLVFQRNWQVS